MGKAGKSKDNFYNDKQLQRMEKLQEKQQKLKNNLKVNNFTLNDQNLIQSGDLNIYGDKVTKIQQEEKDQIRSQKLLKTFTSNKKVPDYLSQDFPISSHQKCEKLIRRIESEQNVGLSAEDVDYELKKIFNREFDQQQQLLKQQFSNTYKEIQKPRPQTSASKNKREIDNYDENNYTSGTKNKIVQGNIKRQKNRKIRKINVQMDETQMLEQLSQQCMYEYKQAHRTYKKLFIERPKSQQLDYMQKQVEVNEDTTHLKSLRNAYDKLTLRYISKTNKEIEIAQKLQKIRQSKLFQQPFRIKLSFDNLDPDSTSIYENQPAQEFQVLRKINRDTMGNNEQLFEKSEENDNDFDSVDLSQLSGDEQPYQDERNPYKTSYNFSLSAKKAGKRNTNTIFSPYKNLDIAKSSIPNWKKSIQISGKASKHYKHEQRTAERSDVWFIRQITQQYAQKRLVFIFQVDQQEIKSSQALKCFIMGKGQSKPNQQQENPKLQTLDQHRLHSKDVKINSKDQNGDKRFKDDYSYDNSVFNISKISQVQDEEHKTFIINDYYDQLKGISQSGKPFTSPQYQDVKDGFAGNVVHRGLKNKIPSSMLTGRDDASQTPSEIRLTCFTGTTSPTPTMMFESSNNVSITGFGVDTPLNSQFGSSNNLPAYKEDRVKLEDFNIIKVVGRGAYGKVYKAKFKRDNEIYAIKAIKKDYLIQHDSLQYAILERKIMTRLRHPNIISLQYAFQNSKRFYMVFEFMDAGELFMHLQESGKFNVERVREYSAQILLALEYIHKKGIIYRDLKLENILMDKKGFIKLADFGLAKIQQEDQIKIKGMLELDDPNYVCGTLEYLSPEVVRDKKYDTHTDLWSLGVLIYEMLSGRGPFVDRSKKQLFNKILTHEVKVEHIQNQDARDLIKKLLTKDLSKRLKDIKDIKKHKFFSKIDWNEYTQQNFNPIYVPYISNQNDCRYFDKEFTKENLNETPVESRGNFDNYSFDPDNFKFSMLSDDTNFVNRQEFVMYNRRFVEAVLEYTQAPQIDIIAHSMGVTFSRRLIKGGMVYGDIKPYYVGEPINDKVNTFIGIAGPNWGAASCNMDFWLQNFRTCNKLNGFYGGSKDGSPTPPDMALFLKELILDPIKEADFTFGIMSLYDTPNKIFGRYNTEWPTMDKMHIFDSPEYTHVGSRDLSGEMQYNCVTYHDYVSPDDIQETEIESSQFLQ
eukprot:403363248